MPQLNPAVLEALKARQQEQSQPQATPQPMPAQNPTQEQSMPQAVPQPQAPVDPNIELKNAVKALMAKYLKLT